MDLTIARRVFTGSEAPIHFKALQKQTLHNRGAKKPQTKPALNFILMEGDPSETQAKTSREKAVKSHVAHVQHFKKWKKQQNSKAATETALATPDPEVEEMPRRFGPRVARRPMTTTTITTRKRADVFCMCDTPDGSCINNCNLKDALKWMEEMYGLFLRVTAFCSSKLSGGGFRNHPFSTFPIEMKGDVHVPEVFDHYLYYMTPPVPDLDHGEPGSVRRLWLPFALAEPSVFQVVMLLAASSNAMLRGQSVLQSSLLNLKAKSIKSINEGLRDPARAHSDHIVMAVAKMAVYEAMYGSHRAYCIHMGGLLRMLEMKVKIGHDSNLGTNGMLTRICFWLDDNLSALLNVPRFLTSLEEKVGFTTGRIVGEY